ncbi:hypothetical protein BKA70DRAFT_1514713 [Coprinopsis sp. MPI-PUGE-AT-0042]|nr:hypothetical protein BKA70DRAFT_1514713 [Coprinopsis sp. MPI-PUGE-AT-0042]
MADSMPIERIWSAALKSYAPNASKAGGSGDGRTFYDRFVIDKGKTRIFFSGCIAYNRTVDAMVASQPALPVRQQESILRLALAEWKKRLLAGPVDDLGRKHWELGLKTVEAFNQSIWVDDARDIVQVPRVMWKKEKSQGLALLVEGRHPGEHLGLEGCDNYRLGLYDGSDPDSFEERFRNLINSTKRGH